ncbi:helix-turn-helix domain-containing protein [Micromonospora sp. NPDC047548]|uniref:TetR/AcrR family transcriptional regulator n=1 Tax=Micromonospora sp. NPDC047548 TaxID=3155624 RepID=UPI0033CA58B0
MAVRLTRAQKQQQTRERLLEAAETLFATRGIHQTSLDDIAAEAGLSKGAVYANFDSKAGLLLALLQRHNETCAVSAGGQQLTDSLTWQRRLGESFEANVATAESRQRTMAIAEFWLYGMRNAEAREVLSEALNAGRQANAAEVATKGHLGMSAGQLAALIMALDIGIGLQHLIDPERVPADLFTAGLEMLLRGAAEAAPR